MSIWSEVAAACLKAEHFVRVIFRQPPLENDILASVIVRQFDSGVSTQHYSVHKL